MLSWRDVAELTPAKAADLYRRYFWEPLCCDETPSRLACALFDTGVNVGRSRAAKWLQHLVGSARDGIIGSKTLARLDGICPRPDLATGSNGDHSPAEWALVIALGALRAKHYYKLAVEEDWARRFLRGWISRADDLEKELAGWEA